MNQLAHLVLPSLRCSKLRHDVVDRPKQPGPGSYTVCKTCTVAYGMAWEATRSEDLADRFVQSIRRGR